MNNNLKILITKFKEDLKNTKVEGRQLPPIVIHILIQIVIFIPSLQLNIPDSGIIAMYGFISMIGLMCWYHKALINVKVYGIWLLIGFIQFIIYLIYGKEPMFLNSYGIHSSLAPHASVFIMLITFQILRQIFYLIESKEIIFYFQKFNPNDFYDKKTMTWLNVFFSMILFMITVPSMVILA
jgi:hypothetical protein